MLTFPSKYWGSTVGCVGKAVNEIVTFLVSWDSESGSPYKNDSNLGWKLCPCWVGYTSLQADSLWHTRVLFDTMKAGFTVIYLYFHISVVLLTCRDILANPAKVIRECYAQWGKFEFGSWFSCRMTVTWCEDEQMVSLVPQFLLTLLLFGNVPQFFFLKEPLLFKNLLNNLFC